MKIQIYKVNEEGFLIDIKTVLLDQPKEEDWIYTEMPNGLYKAKWDGEKWLEAGKEPDQTPKLPSLEKRLETAENTILSLLFMA
ncbi:hypothetical protein [Carnobacterium antarcticum]|uniref:Phage protein n=1 Tax=Carnobacterium antarcticum TaxID=2126436 RepID=A0ABW4NLP0_9LACT|nr:hypothetical protein [Carnobacterium sp. CP1]ALV21070.1 hypothetical protein NY10_450 [Carnobacterium sp. CP1]